MGKIKKKKSGYFFLYLGGGGESDPNVIFLLKASLNYC